MKLSAKQERRIVASAAEANAKARARDALRAAVWMPHAGHFICGMYCSFHLNTYVNGYIVSTVGEYRPATGRGGLPRLDSDPPREIGSGRLYETMVFHGMATDWSDETPTSERCCPYAMTDADNIDFAAYNKPGDAYAGHIKMLGKYAKAKRGGG